MGGKNPAIVLDDAENLDRVAAHVVNGAFWNMGENCSATSRLIVQEAVKDALLERIVAHAREWPMGDPLDPVNRVGALVSKAHFDKVCGYLEQGQDRASWAARREAAFMSSRPSWTSPDRRRQAREEIFGPVLSVLTVDSFDEAIALANDTDYGLAASIFTANVKRALRGARAIRAGTVTVNSFGEGDISTPFGGFKQSGFGGRDNGIHAHDQYTQHQDDLGRPGRRRGRGRRLIGPTLEAPPGTGATPGEAAAERRSGPAAWSAILPGQPAAVAQPAI